MTFIWYHLLWLLLLIPLIILVYILIQRRRKKFALRYTNLSLVKEAMGKGPGKRRHIPAILFLIGLAVAITALARPAATVTLPASKGTVILAIDVSGSMRADDIKPTRLDAAKNAAKLFVEKQPENVRIGIVSFSDTTAVVQSPTTDHAEIMASINRLMPQRGTAIGNGIITSMNTIFEISGKSPPVATEAFTSPDMEDKPLGSQQPSGNYSYAAIVLLSDGVSNVGPSPLQALTSASDNGVKIYTVGVGSEAGAILRFSEFAMRVRLDEDTLKTIAERTGGQYFRAGSETDLQQIYQKLSTELVFKPQLTELTAFFTAFAVLLLIVSAALSLLWFNRVL